MTIIVTRNLALPMAQNVQVRSHQFSADVAVEGGGSDAGPSPHDLYDAALASCKALTVTWYASRKGLPLTDVRVDIDRDATQERHGVYRVTTRLHLRGDLSEQQRAELLAVAGQCPIHKLMSSVTTEITTVLASI
ncbi:MAG: OsmC family protein [Pseudomonadota bacterium]|nr:OsmC family protein [Pseudomonadota bacterium]